MFCGEEVFLESEDLLETIRVTRISDGTVMLDLPFDDLGRGIAFAPDGSSVCLYGYYRTPQILFASDPDTLVEKARKRLEDTP